MTDRNERDALVALADEWMQRSVVRMDAPEPEIQRAKAFFTASTELREALAAPATSVDDEVREWVRANLPESYADKPLIEILRLLNAAGMEAEQDLIDSAGGAKDGEFRKGWDAGRTMQRALMQPAEGDGAVAAPYGYEHDGRFWFAAGATPWVIHHATPLYTRPAATAQVPRPSDDELWDQTLRESDDAEEALGDMFQAVTGRPAEWSSAWHYKDAIEEVEDHMAMLAAAPAAPKGGVVDNALDALKFLAGVRLFVTSRERIKAPEGEDLFDAAIETVRAALTDTAPNGVDAPKHGDDAGDGLRYVLCQVGFGDHYKDWLLIPHVDGQYVTAAKLQPFSMSILRAALATGGQP